MTIFVVLLVATGCQSDKAENVIKANPKKEIVAKEENKETPTITKEELPQLLMSSMETIQNTLDKLWDENEWTSSNDAKANLDLIKEALKNVASEGFVDTQVKEMLDNRYYEGTDIQYFPTNIQPEIRADIELNKENLKITTFTPENLIWSGASVTFDYKYDNDKWILQSWNLEKLTDLKLSKEEAIELLKAEGSKEITFVEEREMEGENVFVFEDNSNGLIIFNPNTTELTYGSTEEPIKEETPEPTQNTQLTEKETSKETSTLTNVTKVPGKSDYLAKLDEVTAKEKTDFTGSTYEDGEKFNFNINLWESTMDDLLSKLKNELSLSAYAELEASQENWNQETDARIEREANEFADGGTMNMYAKSNLRIEAYKERTYWIVNQYMN